MQERLPIRMTVRSCHEKETIWPSEYLLLLVLEGSAGLTGDRSDPLKRGTIVFLAPYSGCRISAEIGTNLLYASIDQVFMEQMIGLPKQHCVILSEERAFPAAEKLVQLFDLQARASQPGSKESSQLQSYSTTFELLALLEPLITFLPGRTGTEEAPQDRAHRLQQYVMQHFKEQIQLQDLADAFGLSRQHASTTFHQEVGQSFSDYLREYRLAEAMRLLMTTELSISDICWQSGFPNQKALQTAFRGAYGMNPREYRSAQQEKRKRESEKNDGTGTEGDLRHVSALLKSYRMVYEQSGQQLHFTADIPDAGAALMRHSEAWRDILNIDTAALCLYSAVQEDLRSLQSSLAFRYVRLGNIFNSEFIPYMPATGRHRFTWFIQVINFFREIGLTPMLILGDSYLISQDFLMINDGAYSVGKDDWLKMLQELLETALSCWDRDWLSTWRFEFHMPDQIYGSGDPEVYMDVFADSCALVHSFLPEASVGGPGMRMDAEHMPRWDAWFRFAKHDSIRIDFISMELWAEYSRTRRTFAGQFGEVRYAQSLGTVSNADAEIAVERVRQVREKMAEAGYGDTRLYVSALGIVKYQAKPAQLGGHCPAWLIRCISGMQGLADGIGCWKALNNEAEYPDEYQVLGYGCGLLSRYGLRNPNWYAYDFLSRLLPYEFLREQYCCVTGDRKGNYAILIHNCKNYSDYFCRNFPNAESEDFANPRLYQNSTALVQTLRLPEYPAQVTGCRVRQFLLGDHHGCLASVLEQMGDVSRPNGEEISYIAGQALPYQYSYHLPCKGRPELTLSLQPNEVMLLLVSPE